MATWLCLKSRDSNNYINKLIPSWTESSINWWFTGIFPVARRFNPGLKLTMCQSLVSLYVAPHFCNVTSRSFAVVLISFLISKMNSNTNQGELHIIKGKRELWFSVKVKRNLNISIIYCVSESIVDRAKPRTEYMY